MTTYKCADCQNEFEADEARHRCLACNVRHSIKSRFAEAEVPAEAPKVEARLTKPMIKALTEPIKVPKPEARGDAKERRRWVYERFKAKHGAEQYHCPKCGMDSPGFYCKPCRRARTQAWRDARKKV